MNRIAAYTLNWLNRQRPSAPNLDNSIIRSSCIESEENMSLNKKRIRRAVEFDGATVWITADTEREYADKLLKLASTNHKTASEKHSFTEYAYRWFEVFSKPNVAAVTAVTYESQMKKHILPALGEKAVEDITPADIQKVFNCMSKDAKQETKNKVKNVLSQILKMAVEEELISRNPLQSSSLRIKGQASAATKPYTVEQMRYLAGHLDQIPQETDRAWLALSISLPLRPEEVLGLTWADVDEESCVLHIRNTVTHPTRNEPEFKPYTKTAASVRDLVFPREVLKYLPERGRPEEFVVGGRNPISYTQLRGVRKRITYALHFDETITPRRFRTTVATDISAATHDLKLVQRMLGHSTPQMTLKHYDKGRGTAADAAQAISKCYGFDSVTDGPTDAHIM